MKNSPRLFSTVYDAINEHTKLSINSTNSIRYCFIAAFMLCAFISSGQTTVSYTAMTTITCPATPTATISPAVSGLTFSQISRGVGVTCSAAGGSISGSGYNNTLANNIAASKWYTYSITSNASVSFTVSSLNIVSRASNITGGPTVSVQYSIGGTSPTNVIGSYTPTTSAATYTITPGSPISVGANQTLNIYIIPNNLTASATTCRVENNSSVTITTTAAATPTIALSGSLSPLTKTYGTASSTTSFSLTGTDMTNSIVVGPLNGFEFADNSVGTYFSTLTLANAASVSKTIGVRLASTTAVGIYSGTINVTSTNAATQTISIGSSTVNQKPITITGITANNKPFDGNTNATFSGTASLVGVESADISNVILGGAPVATFASSAIANGIAVSVSGYSISGTASGNYSLSQPTGLSANITAASLTPQTITFNPLANATYGDAPITLTATASSGLTVLYSSSNTNVATISGSILTFVGAGTTIIIASQAGNATYDVAPNVQQSQLVNVKNLTVTGATANSKPYDGTNAATISGGTLVGVVSPDVVTLNGTSGTFASVNAGTNISVTTAFSLGGADASKYSLTQSTLSADIIPASQTIIFNTLAAKTFGNADFALTATGGGSGNTVTFLSDNSSVATILGNVVTITGAGTANITASQAGNTNYNPATNVIQALLVNQAPQTISFAALANRAIGDAPFTLSATGGASGNAVTFQSSNPSVATVAGNTITIVGVGNTTITASQTGNTNYLAANDVIRNLIVTCPIIAAWDMNSLTGGTNNFGTSPYNATAVSANATAGGLSRGSGVSTTGSAAARGWGGLGWNNLTAQDNITANKFISFSAKPTTGYSMNLCSMSPIDYRRSATGPTNGLLQYSTDGTSFFDITTLNFTSTSSAGASIGLIDLSSITALQNIPSSTTATFRLVPYGATSSSGTFYLFDVLNSTANDFALTGSLNVCAPSASITNTTICSNATPYSWNTQSLNTSGTYTATFMNSSGCDSVATLNLTVNNTSSSSSFASACNSYTWPLNSQTYTVSGVYTFTSLNASGCLHTDSLHVGISSGTSNTTSITSCDSYTWTVNGVTYTASGTYTNVTACHAEILILTIGHSTSSNQTVTNCDAYTWSCNGVTYNASGVYTCTSLNTEGCIHITTLNLTITNSSMSLTSATACDSFTWSCNGAIYTMSGVYSCTSLNAAGCLHTTLLTLTITPSTSNTSTVTACGSYLWAINNVTYTASGTYTYVSACHTEILILSITSTNTITTSVASCDSYTWSLNGTTYTASGTYTFQNGCNTEILMLTINHSTSTTSSVNTLGCYTWPVNNVTYTASGVYTYTTTDPATGCVKTFTVNVTAVPGGSVAAHVILSGPYDTNTGLMQDSLRVQGIIPGTEPYSNAPFNKPAIGEPGGEMVSPTVLAVTGNNAIVDWIYLELRSASNPANIMATKRALLQRDGDIVSNVDGVSPVFFSNLALGNYYVSVKHRNHTGVMSANPLAIVLCTPATINFSSSSPVYTNLTLLNPARKAIGAVNALWSGDANNNKNVKYNGLSNDKETVLAAVGGVATPNNILYGYRTEDVNMDGKVKYNSTDNDRVVVINNVGVSTPNNVLYQHTPN